MSILLVAVLVLLHTFQSAFANQFSRNYPGNAKYASSVFSVGYGVIASIVTFAIALFRFHPSGITWAIGAANAVVLVLYNAMLLRATSLGSYSVTMIFNLSGCILIPLGWSVFHDGEVLSVWQYIAIAVLLVSFVFLNWETKKPGEERPKLSLAFLAACLALFTANGLYGTLLNAQKRLTGGGEDAEMIIVTYALSSVLAFVLLAVQAKGDTLPAFRLNKKSTAAMLAAALCAATAVNLLMYCLTLINVAVLYALDDGGVLLVSVLWAVVALKEKLNRQKVVGLILAAAAVFALSIL